MTDRCPNRGCKDGKVTVGEAAGIPITIDCAFCSGPVPVDPLALAKAVILFHSASPWDQAKDAEFNALLYPLLGREPEATTKCLCDAARAVIAKAEGRS